MIREGYGRTSRIKAGLFVSALLLCGAAEAQDDAPEITFTVNKFNIVGQLPFSEAKVEEVLDPFTGEHSGLDGLQAAGDALEAALREAGYAFFEVDLPPQTLTEGLVSLEVVQQRIGAIRVSGYKYFNEENVKASVPSLVVGLPPNTREISRSVGLANDNPSKNIKVAFSGGRRAGEIDANIKVEDHRQWNFFTSLSNTGNNTSGKWRNTLGFQHNNVFDKDHTYTAALTYAPGESSAVSQLSASYRMPLYGIKGALSFFISRSDLDINLPGTGAATPGGSTDISVLGGGQVSGISYSQFLLNIGRYRHSVGLAYDDKLFDSSSFLQGNTAPLAASKNRSTPIRLFYDLSYQYSQNSWAAQVQYLKNLELNNYNEQRDYGLAAGDPQVDWDAWKLNVYQDVGFGPNWVWRLQASGQQANEPLISGEQYGLGGIATVRGYAERVVRGDNAILVRNELWLRPLGKIKMRPLVFYDWGRATEYRQPGTGREVEHKLAGYGLGLRWQWREKVSAQLDVARARDDIVDASGNRLEDSGDIRGHFSVFARF